MTRPAGLLVTVCLLAAGCSRTAPAPAGGVPYRLGDRDGRLTMALGQLTLVFEGIPADPSANGTTGTLFVSGSGGGSVDVGRVSVKHKEADGICTVTVNSTVWEFPSASVTLRDAEYDPGVVYTWVTAGCAEVVLSTKFHRYEATPTLSEDAVASK